jgi:hypothetical protein
MDYVPSGAQWHACFSASLRAEGFVTSKGDPDVWLRADGDHYEYIWAFVDDVAIAAKPGKGAVFFQEKNKYKVKGDGPISFHLGGDFFRDDDGTLSRTLPGPYINKMMVNFENFFGHLPKDERHFPFGTW